MDEKIFVAFRRLLFGILCLFDSKTDRVTGAVDGMNGILRLDLLLAGGSPAKGVAGSDALVVLNCTAINTGTAHFTFVTDSTAFRDIANTPMAIKEYVGGKVVVK